MKAILDAEANVGWVFPADKNAPSSLPTGRLARPPGRCARCVDDRSPAPRLPSRDGASGLWLADAGARVPELRLFRTGDAIERIVRWEADRTVTEADRDEYGRHYRELISEMEERERRRSHEVLLEHMPWPGRFPAYDEVMTDDVGRLWVAEYLRADRVEADDPQQWTVFSADGRRVLGWYVADRRWANRTVKWIGEDRILVVERDELDVERLRVYRIQKGREER